MKKEDGGRREIVGPVKAGPHKIYFATPLKAFPALNLTTLEALILIGSPVFGLRPVRALRFET